MASAPVVIGLTGGIASGKSAVAAMLRERGADVIDADELARRVVAPGQPALAEIVARFGPQVLLADGGLDRKQLGAIVFSDAAARADLGRITHPRIAAAAQAEIARAAARGAQVVFYEAALLVENGLHRALDGVIVVAIPPSLQRARLIGRDGLSPEAAEARIAAQLPLAEKLEAATWVIDNTGDREALRGEVERVLAAIAAKHGVLRRSVGEPEPAAGAGRAGAGRASQIVFVTGFPSPVARLMIEHVLAQPPSREVVMLAPTSRQQEALAYAAALSDGRRPAPRVLCGDEASMHLGLSATEYRELARDVVTIHHLASVTHYPKPAEAMRAAVLRSTESAIELAGEAPRLARLVHWSSALVADAASDQAGEGELARGDLVDPRLRALRDAEAMVKAIARRVPVTVLRPAIVVGDSRTGALPRELPWYDALPRLVEHVAAGAPLDPRACPPGAAVQVVPVDFLIAAAHVFAAHPEAAGRTFRLCDPTPMTYKELVARVAAACGAKGAPSLLRRAAAWLRRESDAPLSLCAAAGSSDAGRSLPIAESAALDCPTLATYLPLLVEHILSGVVASAAQGDDEPDDPLA